MGNLRTYASILVPMDLTKGARDRAALAHRLALRFEARLIGAAAEQPVTELADDTMIFTSAAARAIVPAPRICMVRISSAVL